MLPVVWVRLPTLVMRPLRARPVAVLEITTDMPRRTSAASLGLSWPAMVGWPRDRVTSEPLASWPTGPASLTTRAGNRGTNMTSDSGTYGSVDAFLPGLGDGMVCVGTGYPSAV